MLHQCPRSPLQRVAVLVAAIFGVVTIFAGGSVLLGLREAGYHVVQPVLVYNTIMGAVYVLVALVAVRSAERGRLGAGVIALLNLVVLVALTSYAASGGEVAEETFRAMVFRTVVWAAIYAALVLVIHREKATPQDA
jgi:hypothetical protein